jgi:hypothetical protein
MILIIIFLIFFYIFSGIKIPIIEAKFSIAFNTILQIIRREFLTSSEEYFFSFSSNEEALFTGQLW